jgi:hypothetical protein
MVFGANFALQTGQPTSPNGQYEYLELTFQVMGYEIPPPLIFLQP